MSLNITGRIEDDDDPAIIELTHADYSVTIAKKGTDEKVTLGEGHARLLMKYLSLILPESRQ